jgi:hypothetical protein
MTAALLAAQSSPSLQQRAIIGDRQGDAGHCQRSARGDHPCLGAFCYLCYAREHSISSAAQLAAAERGLPTDGKLLGVESH